jgi:hypothetical protein
MPHEEQLPLPTDALPGQAVPGIDEMAAAGAGAPVGAELPPMPLEGLPPELTGGVPGMPPEGMPPELAGMPMPPGAEGGGPSFDDLLAEIDQFSAGEVGVPPAPAMAEPSVADAFASMRDRFNQGLGTPETQTDGRIQALEQQLSQMQNNNDRLQQENVKRGITTAISDGISVELKKVGIDPTSKAGKGLSRIVHNATLVSVAQAQASSGAMDVDVTTVRKTVTNWAKIFNLVASEIAAHTAAKRRLTTKGAPSNPAAPRKASGDMSDAEFDSAVLSMLRQSSS